MSDRGQGTGVRPPAVPWPIVRAIVLGMLAPNWSDKAQTAGQKPSGRLRLLLNKGVQPLRQDHMGRMPTTHSSDRNQAP
jgi:hypothetical protein